MPDRCFTQDDRGTRLTFWFKEDYLAYKHEDGTGMTSQRVLYEAIDIGHPSELLLKSHYLKRPDVFVLLAGIALLENSANPIPVIGVAFGMVYVFLGIKLCYLRKRAMRYTFFQTRDGKIRMMQDRQYDSILETLKTYRIARMRKLYGAINPANDPAKELMKFQQLQAMGIITEQEFEQARAQLQGKADPAPAIVQ